MTESIDVLLLMGSDSDWEVMAEASRILQQFSIAHETRVTSAHRTPERTVTLIRKAEAKGSKVIIAGAGAAAHLAGVVAAHTTLPVIGVPLNATSLQPRMSGYSRNGNKDKSSTSLSDIGITQLSDLHCQKYITGCSGSFRLALPEIHYRMFGLGL